MTSSQSRFVKEAFSARVARSYELINHLLTLGQDIRWRKRAARIAASHGGQRWADVCTGTGETAMYLSRLAPADTEVYGIDFALPMLEQARRKPEAAGITFVESDVKSLPFEPATLDLITISFATRNINLDRGTLVKTFAEFHRVLKPGGHFINLETSQPRNATIRKLFHFYVGALVKPVGTAISGSKVGYSYLRQTIPRFYDADELAAIMTEAGFEDVTYRRMFLGVAAIHVGSVRSDT